MLGAPHFTASEISVDRITAPISPPRNSPPAKFTDFALHRLVNLRHDEFSADEITAAQSSVRE